MHPYGALAFIGQTQGPHRYTTDRST